MTDYAHGSPRSTAFIERHSIESRVMFVACWILFLARAVILRTVHWRSGVDRESHKESILSEASTAASVCVTSAFIGL